MVKRLLLKMGWVRATASRHPITLMVCFHMRAHSHPTNGSTHAQLPVIGAANSFPQRHPLRVTSERFHAEKTGRQPAWLSHSARGLKIPRRKACRFDSGPGHHVTTSRHLKQHQNPHCA
jgi:hypothetical protein